MTLLNETLVPSADCSFSVCFLLFIYEGYSVSKLMETFAKVDKPRYSRTVLHYMYTFGQHQLTANCYCFVLDSNISEMI